jgi:hypothetical protein
MTYANLMKRSVAILGIALLAGCASVAEFPTSAQEVNFDGEQGHTGWAKYEKTTLLTNTQLKDALAAGEKALAASRFELRKNDPAGAVVIGEHGATPFDYNIIAALYFRQEGKGVRVRIHVQASRDIGFLGDATDRNWTLELESSLKAILDR